MRGLFDMDNPKGSKGGSSGGSSGGSAGSTTSSTPTTSSGGGGSSYTLPAPPPYTSTPPLPSTLTQPFLDLASVASQLGTLSGQAVPGAAQWQTDLFNPGFNQGELMFMNLFNQQRLEDLNRASAANMARYGQTPFHSGAYQSENDLANQSYRSLLQAGSTLQQARQERALQALNNVFSRPLEMAGVAPQVATSLLGLIQQNRGTGALGFPMSFYGQLPYIPPSILTGSTVVGSSGGGKK